MRGGGLARAHALRCAGEAERRCSLFLTEGAVMGLILIRIKETQVDFNQTMSFKTKNAVSDTARLQLFFICLYSGGGREGEHRTSVKAEGIFTR